MYRAASDKSSAKGYLPPAQIIVEQAEGDFVWDMEAIAHVERKGVTVGDYPSMPSGNVGF